MTRTSLQFPELAALCGVAASASDASERRELQPGERAFVILQDAYGTRGARTVVGAARVVVLEAVEGGYRVRTERGHMRAGRVLVLPRAELHAAASPEERETFAALVRRFWQSLGGTR